MKYLVKYWENEYRRDQGISDILIKDININDAVKEATSIVKSGRAVCSEILNQFDECIYTFDNDNVVDGILIELCKGCIEDLDNYNPYIYDNKETIPLDNIIISKVGVKYCNNTEHNLGLKNPIKILI